MPRQTHDDSEWLDEEDGEQNVSRNGRFRDGEGRSPVGADVESRSAGRQDDARPENRVGECGYKRRI
jgi:hypothetical protein